MRKIMYHAGAVDPNGQLVHKNALYTKPYGSSVPMLMGGNHASLVVEAHSLEVDWETGAVSLDMQFSDRFIEEYTRHPEIKLDYDDFDYSFYANNVVYIKNHAEVVHARLRAVYVMPKPAFPTIDVADLNEVTTDGL